MPDPEPTSSVANQFRNSLQGEHAAKLRVARGGRQYAASVALSMLKGPRFRLWLHMTTALSPPAAMTPTVVVPEEPGFGEGSITEINGKRYRLAERDRNVKSLPDGTVKVRQGNRVYWAIPVVGH